MKKIIINSAVILSVLFLSFSSFAKIIDVLSFNDFHAALKEEGKNPGMAKFVYALKHEASKNPKKTIIVSAGDSFQGSAISVLTHGKPVIDMMNELGVPVSAVGNHEFDWGIKVLKQIEDEGDFIFVAANIIDRKTGKIVSWAKPYVIINKDGVKIAFIGLTTLETPFKTNPDNIKDIKFTDPTKALQKWINFLEAGKDKNGKPDVIIALTHIESYQNNETGKITGKTINDICNKVNGINAIISAHSHELVSGYINKVPVIQAYCNGRAIGCLKIFLNEKNKLEKIEPKVKDLYTCIDSLKEDPEAKEIYKKYSKNMSKIDKIIGKTDEPLYHKKDFKGVSSLGELICKAVTVEEGTQIAILNGGGLRTSLKKGNITISEMYDLIPFDNYIITMKLKGSDLKRVIEHGLYNPDPDTGDGQFYGIKVFYDSKAPYTKRIKSMALLDGTPIIKDKYYTVGTLDFIYKGGDKYDFSGAKDVRNTQIT